MRYAKTRQAMVKLLQHWTGQDFAISEDGIGIDELAAAYEAWFQWFEKRYPDESARFKGLAGLAEWNDRFGQIDWTTGDVDRGKVVFQRLQCATCHSGDRRLGPDLQPIARRFSRDDLFASIIEPNQSVSPAYQTKRFETASGRVFSGMVVYESPNGTLLQIGPDDTVRIADDEIVEITSSPTSLMPNGLLRDATDQDLTDLYAYLQQLAKQ
jgi:putative heme-binding domain-containing protein